MNGGEKPVKRAAVMLLVVICGSFMGCSHVAVYRTAGPAEPIAKRVCFEVGGGGNTELEQGLMSCVILHGLRFRVGYSGNTLRVISPDAWTHADVALHLGRLSQESSSEITLEEFK